MAGKQKKQKVKVMYGCPEDAEKFIRAIDDGLADFNSKYGTKFGVELEGRYWKRDTYAVAENAQKAINKQLCEECNMLISVFYKDIGSAVSSSKPGTIEEIEYFRKREKQAFVFLYSGTLEIDISNSEKMKKAVEYFKVLSEQRRKIYYKEYKDENDLKEQIVKNLRLYYEAQKNEKKNKKSQQAAARKKNNSSLQTAMREHLHLCDEWNALDGKFKFVRKAEELIDGIQEDGSIQYYVGAKERYRTTPVASVLEALYSAGLLPPSACHKMQDWVYNSRQDPCDEPGEKEDGEGHPPEPEDAPGWSWNEGVSVWATSKALDTLIVTGYYERSEVIENKEIINNTWNALQWLVDQAYPSGGWGFQKAVEYPACKESVTMTALALRVLIRFLKAFDGRNRSLKLTNELEKKISNAKQKGIDYLCTLKKEEEGKIYWEHNGEKSLTATVWVLDFINVAGRNEAGELYPLKNKIRSYCLESLPETDAEYDCYRDEVYFSGGQTKYKFIEENNKFYSYLPYHIPVLLTAGVSPDKKQIMVCIRALVVGKEDYWNGTDKSLGYHQKQSCFVLAMALSVLAIWMKKMARSQLLPKVNIKWETEKDEYEEG